MALTFTSVGTVDYGSRRRITVLRAINTTGSDQVGQAVITATVSGTFQEMLWIADLAGSGVNTGTPNDASQVNSGTGLNALATADVGTIDAGDCAYGAFAIEGSGGTFTEGASYTKLDSENAGGNVRQLLTQYSTSDDTPDVTWSTTSDAGGVGCIINGVASLTNQTSGSSTSNGASVASITVPNNTVLYIAVAVAAVGGGTVTSIAIDGTGFAVGGSEPYSATGSTGIQNFQGFQASQIGLHRNIQPGIAYFNAQGFAPSTSAGFQIDAATGYANFVGFNAQSIQDEIGIAGRINFNTGTHQTHVTRQFFGLLGQLRALGFLVDQTNSQGFFPNLGSIVFQGPTGATVTVFTAPTTFTAAALLRETHFVGFQAQTIRDFFPISANTHALGFTPQYVEFIKEITGPDQGQVNFSGFQAQAVILGQINDAIGQKGEVNLVGFQHAVDMWRTLDSLQGRINMQGFAAGVALFQGGTINLSGITGEVNFDTLQQAIGMYRTFYPDSGLTNAEGYVPVPSTGTLVQSIVGLLNQEGFVPFIVAERYRGIVGEMRLEGFAPTIGGGLWTPKRRRATSWAAIN